MSDRRSQRRASAAASVAISRDAAASGAIPIDTAASGALPTDATGENNALTLDEQEQLKCELEARIAKYEHWKAQGIRADEIRRDLKMGLLRPLHLTDGRYRGFVVEFIVRAINIFSKAERTFVDSPNSLKALTHIFANQYHLHENKPDFDLDARHTSASNFATKLARLKVLIKPFAQFLQSVEVVTVQLFRDKFVEYQQQLWGEYAHIAFNVFIDAITHVKSFKRGGRGYKPYLQFPALVEAEFTDESWNALFGSEPRIIRQAGEGAAGPVYQTGMPRDLGSADVAPIRVTMPMFSTFEHNVWVVNHDPEFQAGNSSYWNDLGTALHEIVNDNPCLQIAGTPFKPLVRYARTPMDLSLGMYVEVDCKEIIQIIGPIAGREEFLFTDDQHCTAGALMKTLMTNNYSCWLDIVAWYQSGKRGLRNVRQSGDNLDDDLGLYSESDSRLQFGLNSVRIGYDDFENIEDNPFGNLGSPLPPSRLSAAAVVPSPDSLVLGRSFARPRHSPAVRMLQMGTGGGFGGGWGGATGSAPTSAVGAATSAGPIVSSAFASGVDAATSVVGVADAAGPDIGAVVDNLVSGINQLRDRLTQVNNEESQYSREFIEAMAKTEYHMARQKQELLEDRRRAKYRRLQLESYKHQTQLECTLILQETQTQKGRLEEQNAELMRQMEGNRAEQNQLQQSIERNRTAKADLERQIQSENEEHQRLLREINERSAETEARIERMHGSLQELNASFTEKQAQKQSLDAQYNSSLLQLRELRAGLDDLLRIKESNRRRSQEITLKEQALELQRQELEAEKQRMREAVLRMPNDWQTPLARLMPEDSRNPLDMLRSMQNHLHSEVREDLSLGAGLPGGSTRYAGGPGPAAGGGDGGSGSARLLGSASRAAGGDGGSGGLSRAAGGGGG